MSGAGYRLCLFSSMKELLRGFVLYTSIVLSLEGLFLLGVDFLGFFENVDKMLALHISQRNSRR